jgi:SHS2 domain-containing protein
MDAYEVIDISGDVGIRAFGKDLKEVFVHAALGMYSLITDIEAVERKKSIDIHIEGDSREDLLVSWLNELIFHVDTYGFIGKNISIMKFTEEALAARLDGEEFNPERHERNLLIKAATYHQLSITQANGLWRAEVIFDI